MEIKPSLLLWSFITTFLILWLGYDLWLGVSSGEILDLRTGNRLLFDIRPFWFSIVFILKAFAIVACFYFLYGVIKKIKTAKENGKGIKSHQ